MILNKIFPGNSYYKKPKPQTDVILPIVIWALYNEFIFLPNYWGGGKLSCVIFFLHLNIPCYPKP